MKVGSKRRRTQAEIFNQGAEDAMHDIVKEQHQSQIALLTNQLSKAKEQADSNKAAADILNQMISQRSASVDQLGNVTLIHNNEESSEFKFR